MYVIPIILAAIFGSACTSPISGIQIRDSIINSDVNTRNSVLEQLVLDTLEILREIMLTGTDTIPILDPLQIDRFHVDEELVGIPDARLTIEDISVKQLSTFVVSDLSITITSLLLQRYRIEFAGHIPVIEINTNQYDIYLPIFGGLVHGNGDAKINVVNPRIQGHIVLAPRISISGLFLNMLECRIGFNLDAFQTQLTGMFDNQASSDFVSAFLENLIPEMLEFFEVELTDLISNIVLQVANEILADLDLTGILGV